MELFSEQQDSKSITLPLSTLIYLNFIIQVNYTLCVPIMGQSVSVTEWIYK